MARTQQGQAPHVTIRERQRWETERDAHEAALEAKYGIPYEKLPVDLRHGAPEHPRQRNTRRFDYVTRTGYRWNARSRAGRRVLYALPQQRGWREQRDAYLAEVERVRRAEIVVRRARTKRTGRGKPAPKNLVAQQRLAIENREFREKSW
jgi:hypothetical protein